MSLKFYVNSVLIGDLQEMYRKEGKVVGSLDIPCQVTVIHDADDSKTDPDMMKSMSEVYSYSGDKGAYTACLAEDSTWSVGQYGADHWYRTGMEEDAAVELAFTLAYTGIKELQ